MPRVSAPGTSSAAVGALLMLFYARCCWSGDYWALPPVTDARDVAPTVGSTSPAHAEACTEFRPCPLSASLVASLRPGDTLRLLPGDYPPMRISDLRGTAEAPIRLSGASPQVRDAQPGAVIRGNKRARDTLEVYRSSYLELSDLTISGAVRAGIRIFNSRGIALLRSTVLDAGTWGIFVDYSNDTRISACHVEGTGRQHGIYFANSGDSARVDNSFIGGFLGSGIHVNGDLSMGGAPGVTGDGMISDLAFVANWIDGTGETGGAGINLDGARDVLVRHNMLTDLKAAGIAVFHGDGAEGSDVVRIEGNLIEGGAGSRDLLIFNRSGSDNTVTGNILLQQNVRAGLISTDRGVWVRRDQRALGLPFRAKSNLFWTAGALITMGDTRVTPEQHGEAEGLGMRALKGVSTTAAGAPRFRFTPPAAFEAQASVIALKRTNRFFPAAVPWQDTDDLPD